MRAKYTAKWGVQMAGMNFQTRSRIPVREFQKIMDLERSFYVTSILYGFDQCSKQRGRARGTSGGAEPLFHCACFCQTGASVD
ncbi:DUF6783 domain-containing protein [Candidatus Ventrimonas sp. KK005]